MLYQGKLNLSIRWHLIQNIDSNLGKLFSLSFLRCKNKFTFVKLDSPEFSYTLISNEVPLKAVQAELKRNCLLNVTYLSLGYLLLLLNTMKWWIMKQEREMRHQKTKASNRFSEDSIRGGMVVTWQSARSHHWSARWEGHWWGISQFAPLKHTKSQDLEAPKHDYSKRLKSAE